MSAIESVFRESELLRFITAGSVDDGKSTLIGRLLHDSKSIFEDQLSAVERTTRRRGIDGIDLSLLTDGLIAEREQGITIDVAYRYFATPKRKFILADAPGHEQYTRNMVTAASKAKLAIILIDARKGVLTQTRRHSYIAKIMGVRHLVVAVNKMDLVDYSSDVFERIRADFEGFAHAIGFHDVVYIPISALHGDMVVERGERLRWYHGVPLLQVLETATVMDDLYAREFRFPVQGVSRASASREHDFRGYMGRIESGAVSVGDEVTVLPSGLSSRVKRIHTYDGDLSHAFAHQSVTLLLEDHIDISRGDAIVKGAPRVAKEFQADMCWLGSEPLQTGRRYLMKHTTRVAKAIVPRVHFSLDMNTLAEHEGVAMLTLNDIGRVSIKAQSPIVFDPYEENRATGAFILMDEASNHTVAAGMIR
jgi:sulfate adenylyltransferase subunit 1